MIRSIKIGELDFYQDDSNPTGKVQLDHGIAYELHVVNELKKWIPTSIGFADIGCNAGIHTIIARSIGWNVPVVCAEASPTNIQLLLKNLAHNGLRGVTVLPFALAEAHRIIAINGCEFNSHCAAFPDQEHQTLCAALPLDMLNLPPVDLIKIDVEGFEMLVLEGASRWMETRPKVIFEFFPELIARTNREPQRLLEYFFERKYKLTVLDYQKGMRKECYSSEELMNHLASWDNKITDIIAEPL